MSAPSTGGASSTTPPRALRHEREAVRGRADLGESRAAPRASRPSSTRSRARCDSLARRAPNARRSARRARRSADGPARAAAAARTARDGAASRTVLRAARTRSPAGVDHQPLRGEERLDLVEQQRSRRAPIRRGAQRARAARDRRARPRLRARGCARAAPRAAPARAPPRCARLRAPQRDRRAQTARRARSASAVPRSHRRLASACSACATRPSSSKRRAASSRACSALCASPWACRVRSAASSPRGSRPRSRAASAISACGHDAARARHGLLRREAARRAPQQLPRARQLAELCHGDPAQRERQAGRRAAPRAAARRADRRPRASARGAVPQRVHAPFYAAVRERIAPLLLLPRRAPPALGKGASRRRPNMKDNTARDRLDETSGSPRASSCSPQEKEFTRLRDAAGAEQRRELPWVRVDKSYVFEGPRGQADARRAVRRRSQLVVYHFMFAPGLGGRLQELLVLGRQLQRHHGAPRRSAT